jgi:integrase
VRLGEITVPQILDFRIVRIDRDKVRDYSVNRQVACLSAIYSCATKWGVWKGSNPCREIEPFKEPPARDRVYSADEVEKILAAAGEDPVFYAMVMTALYTGIRKGALISLEWADLRNGFVVVRHGADKGGRSRPVPIPPALQVVLASMKRNGPLAFHRDGVPFTSDHVDTCWNRVRKKAGIIEGRFHDLRRTYGTAAMEEGIGTGMIQRLLGHQQASTTEAYLHTSRRAL